MAQLVNVHPENLSVNLLQFLTSGGAIGAQMRTTDWSESTLGPAERWPQSLRTTLGLLLQSSTPMLLFWGDESLCFYNDAFVAISGRVGGHFSTLGKPAAIVWPQAWPLIKPLLDQVRSGGETAGSGDPWWPLDGSSNGGLASWTFNYSAVWGEADKVVGVLATGGQTDKGVFSSHRVEGPAVSLGNLFSQAPAAIAVVAGPQQHYVVANPLYQQLFNRTQDQLLGKTVREVFPEIEGQGIYELFTQVYQSGQAYVANEFPVRFRRHPTGEQQAGYFNFTAQPIRDGQGRVGAVMIHAFEVSEQVRNRKKIEENEQQLRIALEGGQLGTYDYYPQSGRLVWSAKTKELFGLPPEAAVAYETFLQGLHPEDKVRSDAAVQRALQPEQGGLYENEYRTLGINDGKLRWIRSKGKTTFDAQGQPVRFTGITQDITSRKQAEEALKESEARFRSQAQNSPDVITRHGKDYRYLYASPRIETFTGIKADAFVGKSYRELGMPEALCCFFDEHLSFVFEHQVQHTAEYHMPGNESYVHSRMVPEFDEAGQVISVLVLSTDISERRKVEQALTESEARFRTLADNMPNLAWMASADGWIFWYNSRWYEYTGTTQAQMEGWGWQSVHDPLVLPKVMEQWTSSIASGKPFEMVFPLRGADGDFRPFLTRVIPVHDEQGQVSKWFGTNTDIYAQQQAQKQLQALNAQLAATTGELAAANEEIRARNEELAHSNRQLIHINNDLDNFIYAASHDLKAPISNIEGLLKALERELTSSRTERVQEIYQFLYASVNRFKTTIRDLTDVARISKESTEDEASISLAAVLGEVTLDLETQIQEARAQLTISLHCEQVRFSRKNLKSVLYNLLSNALKYRSPEREPLVRVSCHEEADYQVLTVEDNGLGMDMQQEEKIFALFKRLHSHVEGTGIGLYIIRKMIENAGGRIAVESQVGIGSTFRVYFKK